MIAKVAVTAMNEAWRRSSSHELRQAQAQLQNGNAAKTCFELGQFGKQADKHSPKQLAEPAADDLIVDAAQIRAVSHADGRLTRRSDGRGRAGRPLPSWARA